VYSENDLTNIVFDYAYNTRHKIGAEDLKTIEHIPYVSEHVWELMTAPQKLVWLAFDAPVWLA